MIRHFPPFLQHLMKKQKKIHFLHIPKTGGTSLSNFLEKQFKASDVCPYVYLKSTDDWIPQEQILNSIHAKEIQKYHFFKGHLGWVPRTIIPDDEIETITFLRHPIARSLSLYKFLKGNISLWDNSSDRWLTFDDFVFDQENGLELRANFQTKSFCADLFFKKSSSVEPMNQYMKRCGALSYVEIDLTPRQMLDLAIERLNQCSFVGITEYFNESFEWLCMQYNWLIPQLIPKDNTSLEKKLEFENDKTLDRILELNNLDLILYQEALKIYKDRKKVRVFINNEKIEKNIIKNNPVLKKIEFTFADKVIGEGWDAREGVLPKIFVWSTATTSTLFFPIYSKHDLHLVFKVNHSIIADLHRKLSLTANELPIALNCHFHSGGGFVFNGIIPKIILSKKKLLKLTFMIPEVIRPIDISKNSKDIRKLGFTLNELKINTKYLSLS